MLTTLDWVFIAIVGLSSLLSLMHGFVREALSLVGWIGAFAVVGKFYNSLASKLTFIDNPTWQKIIAVLILFVGTLFVVGLIGSLIKQMLAKTGMSSIDRILGIVFGMLRGVLICCAIVSFIYLLNSRNWFDFIVEQPWWKDSIIIPELQKIITWFFNYLDNNQGL